VVSLFTNPVGIEASGRGDLVFRVCETGAGIGQENRETDAIP